MKTINFKEFKLYVNIEKTDYIVKDIKNEFANMLYVAANGLAAHALAFKLYNSEDGVIELNDQEIQLLTQLVEQNCVPSFIDSFRDVLNK